MDAEFLPFQPGALHNRCMADVFDLVDDVQLDGELVFFFRISDFFDFVFFLMDHIADVA